MIRNCGPGEKWASACLRVTSDLLASSQIVGALDHVGSHTYDKGQKANSAGKVHHNSMWMLDSERGREGDLASHLESLLDFIETHFDVLCNLAEKCDIAIICGFASDNGQGGAVFEPGLLKRLARTEMCLVLDLYPPDSECPKDSEAL